MGVENTCTKTLFYRHSFTKSDGNETFSPISNITTNFFRENLRCGCIRQLQTLQTRAFVTIYIILLFHPVWTWMEQCRKDLIGHDWTTTTSTSILKNDSHCNIAQTNKTLKELSSAPVIVFSVMRSAAIRARRRILKPFSSDAACVARGDNLINFQRGRKRRDVIYKKKRGAPSNAALGRGGHWEISNCLSKC